MFAVLLGKQTNSTWNYLEPTSSACSSSNAGAVRNWPLSIRAATGNEQNGGRPCPYAPPPGSTSFKAGSSHGDGWCCWLKSGHLWWWVSERCCSSAAHVLSVRGWGGGEMYTKWSAWLDLIFFFLFFSFLFFSFLFFFLVESCLMSLSVWSFFTF